MTTSKALVPVGSRALVPIGPAHRNGPQVSAREATTEVATGRCSKNAEASKKRKWLLLGGIALAIAAAVLGSVWLGMAAVLPFVYVAPLLACLAMCMKGGKCSTSSGTDKQ